MTCPPGRRHCKIEGFVYGSRSRPLWRGGKGELFCLEEARRGGSCRPGGARRERRHQGTRRFYYCPTEPPFSSHHGTATDAKRALGSAGHRLTAAGFGTFRPILQTTLTTQPLMLNAHVIVGTPVRIVTRKTRHTIHSVFTKTHFYDFKTLFHEFPFSASGQRNSPRAKPASELRHPSALKRHTRHIFFPGELRHQLHDPRPPPRPGRFEKLPTLVRLQD